MNDKSAPGSNVNKRLSTFATVSNSEVVRWYRGGVDAKKMDHYDLLSISDPKPWP